MNKEHSHTYGWLVFQFGIVYCCSIFISVKYFGFSSFIIFWTVGIIPLSIFYRTHVMRGMKQADSEVEVHRFHYYEDFKPELTGENLVIAYPVAG